MEKGILQAFLNPKFLSKKEFFKIQEIEDIDKISFIINFQIDKLKKKIVIYFDKVTNNLLGWRVYENSNEYIDVKVLTSKKFQINNDKINIFFTLKNKSHKEEVLYLGPYKNRKIKKTLDSGKLN